MSLSQHNNYARLLRLSLHFNCEFVYFFKLASQIQVEPCPGKFHLIFTCYETSLSLQNHIHCNVKEQFLWFRGWHVGPEFLVTSSRSWAEISTSPGFFSHIMLLTTQMIYGNTWRNSPSHLTTPVLSQRFRFKNSKAGLAFLAVPFVYMLSPPSFRESNGSHNAIRGCSRSEVSLTSSCWTWHQGKKLVKFPKG